MAGPIYKILKTHWFLAKEKEKKKSFIAFCEILLSIIISAFFFKIAYQKIKVVTYTLFSATDDKIKALT